MDKHEMGISPSLFFDAQTVHEITRQIFDKGYPYLGSMGMIPEDGDYRLSDHTGNRILLNDGGIPRSLSNVCRHNKALIIDPLRDSDPPEIRHESSGRLKPKGGFICPLHRWSFARDGSLAAHPYYDADHLPDKKQLCLRQQQLMAHNSLLFPPGDEGLQYDLRTFWAQAESLGARFADIAAQYHPVPFHIDTVHYAFSWITFWYVYQELVHVSPYHPNKFAKIVSDPRKIPWKFGDRWSLQIAAWNDNPRGKVDASYAEYRRLVDHLYETQPRHGALWGGIYPNVMIEEYPLMLVISSLWPENDFGCRNVIEYYMPKWIPEDLHAEVLRVSRAAYDDTAKEDQDICESLERGWRALQDEGENLVLHPHREMDAGIYHFFTYLENMLA